MKRFLLLIICIATLRATTYNSDGTPGNVQALVNGAVGGDTITIPAGSFTWTTGVSVAGKYLTITGAGSGRVLGRSQTSNTVGTGAKTWTTTTGLTITPGQTLRIYRTCGELGPNGWGTGNAIWCEGTVTSYSGTSLVMNITSTSAVGGTWAYWAICSRPQTTIVNNVAASSPVFSLTESANGSTNLSGLQFTLGTGRGAMIQINYNAGQPTLIHDSWIEIPTSGGDGIKLNTNSGVVWNVSFFAPSFAVNPTAIHQICNSLGTSWTTTSTFGMNDTGGTHNFYVEDCDLTAMLSGTDFDSNSRTVVRYCTFDYASIGTHGADTSSWGVRHFEVYNSTFIYVNQGVNSPNLDRYFYVRGGTFAIHSNVIPNMDSGGTWGTKPAYNLTVMNLQRMAGPNGGWGVINTSGRLPGWGYPAPRQVGFGRVTGTATFPAWSSGGPYPGPGATWSGNYVTFSGATYKSTVANSSTSNPSVNTAQWSNTGYAAGFDSVTYIGDSEPAYIWNNTPTGGSTGILSISDYGANQTNSVSTTAVPITCDSSANYIVLNRDYFYDTTGSPSSGAKPGYTPYTYPHPLHSGFVAVPVITTNPTSQTVTTGANVTFVSAASGSPTWQWTKDGSPIVGATNSTFSIIGVAGGDAGDYAATATNGAGSATTTAATLTVTAAPSPATGVPATPVITGIIP